MRKQVMLVLCFVVSGPLLAKTLATVGTYTITDKDVKTFIEDIKKNGFSSSQITENYALNKLIDFKLGVIDAKSQTIDQDSDAKEAMDNALYTYYLQKTVDSKYKNSKFSDKELRAYYQKNPLVKMQRITYAFNNRVPDEMNKAKIQISLLRADIKNKKITFEAALEKTKNDAILSLTGTFDKVLISDLAPQEMIELKPLQPMEISPVIQGGNFFAISRIVKVYPFSEEYADAINDRIKQESIISAREKLSKTLRQKYANIIKVSK